MLENFKSEIDKINSDIERHIKSEEEQLYIRKRVLELVDNLVSKFEDELNYNEMRFQELTRKEEFLESKLESLSETVNGITRDIYDEEENFEIICPYCNYEFESDIGEDIEEIKCPECGNIIELDWDGNIDGDDDDRMLWWKLFALPWM